MSFSLQSLAADFPEHVDEIRKRAQRDGDFSSLVAQYDAVNAKVYRAEAEFDLISQEVADHLRKARTALRGHIERHLI